MVLFGPISALPVAVPPHVLRRILGNLFANAIEAWDFVAEKDGRRWRGRVAGPDRLRFLGMLSRYAAVLRGIEMKERDNEQVV